MSKDRLNDSRVVYDEQAQAFAEKGPQLLTWEFCGKPFFKKALVADYKKASEGSKVMVLDVGSASGRVVQVHVDNGVLAGNILGVEISPKEVEIARQQIPGVTFEVGDISDHRLLSEEFDVVTSYMVWEFLDREGLEKALRNVFGALKPGGKLVYATTHPARFIRRYGLKQEGWFLSGGPWGGSFDNFYRSKETFIKETSEAGFVVDEVLELEMPAEAENKYPDRMKSFNSFGAPVRLAVIAHKP